MKNFTFLILLSLFAFSSHAQRSEDFIPSEAVTVFSLNNIELLKKISMDKLVQYDFMSEVHQELFDGSTNGKTMKDSGIDFDQKLNIYYGVGKKYEVAGFTFGVTDKAALFAVFDDFSKEDSPIEGVEFYSSYFNHLLIKGEIGVLIRVDPVRKYINKLADSVWRAQGRGSKYEYEVYEESNEVDEIEESDEIYDVEEEVEQIEDGEVAQAEEVPLKNYSEVRDSIRTVLKDQYLTEIAIDLFISNRNLKKK